MSGGGLHACRPVLACDLGFCGVSGVWVALPPSILVVCKVPGHGLAFREGCRRASDLQALILAGGLVGPLSDFASVEGPLSRRGVCGQPLSRLHVDHSLMSASPDSRSGWGFVSELSRSWVSELSRSVGVTTSVSCGFLLVVP